MCQIPKPDYMDWVLPMLIVCFVGLNRQSHSIRSKVNKAYILNHHLFLILGSKIFEIKLASKQVSNSPI